MSLNDRLEKLESSEASAGCPVSRIIAELDEVTAETFTRVLNSKVSTITIHRELRNEGFKIARDSLSNHRNGHCRCRAVGA